ncbi:hypothetical protein [Actinomycetospora soli]|uniref:hypothetical protein n=1 Tax=Actinomycetospora soli TaxID=2893887 RepID=UPI001E5EBF09|nr:hypothetical protein [Actinomycetospora soli]MCD2189311.1 hypothetical protein [Actinomycetospora soli]
MTTEARRVVRDARPAVDERSSGGWGAWPPEAPGDRPLSMTSCSDRTEHAVMATELEQANRTGQPPMGLCGVVVDPAPLGATGAHVCRPCREAVSRRRRASRPAAPTPWAVLVQWYAALVRLLRAGMPASAGPKAIAAPRQALALPPVPTRQPARAPHPVREPGGRHRRPE